MIKLLIVFAIGIGWCIYTYWGKKIPSSPAENDGDPSQIQAVISLMRQYSLTPEDIARNWAHTGHGFAPSKIPPRKKKDFGEIAPRIFGYLGAVFVLAGIGVYISTFWDVMSSPMRVTVTLGIGIVLNFIAIIALRDNNYPRAIVPLVLTAAAMQMSGWFVFIYEYFPHGNEPQKAVAAVCGVMMLQQGGIFYYFRRTIVAFTALFFLYGFLQAALDLAGMEQKYIGLLLGSSMILVSNSLSKTSYAALSMYGYFFGAIGFNAGLFRMVDDFLNAKWAAIATGISLMLFGYALQQVQERKPAGPAYLFGSCFFYAGLFDLVNRTPWELLYFGVAIGMIYLCTILHSRAILFNSVLALLGFIGYYTRQYFVDSVGWPIALIIMGLAFFGVGMMAIKIKKRYLVPHA